MTSDAFLTELRMLPGAPESLRERVRSLPEPQPRFVWSLPRIDMRRALVVAVPAVVALGVGAAALHGVLAGGTPSRPQPLALDAERHGARASLGGAVTTPSFSAHAGQRQLAPLTLRGDRAVALPPSTTRLNKYNAWLRLRVADDRLAKVTTRAMQIARGYGGYVASVDMNTPGKRGTASLVLRVPVTKVEDAVVRLGKLGTVTAQHVRIQDLQRRANVLQDEILKLRATIAQLKSKLAGPLSADERIRLQYQLDEAKRSLAQRTKARAITVREGTLATVSMTFVTPKPAAAVPHHEGRLGRTLSSAGGFLVRELAWLLYALIVVGPIALLAAAGVVAMRAARRRSDARLLEGA
jgi:Domain of unknown function (DUF4349)